MHIDYHLLRTDEPVYRRGDLFVATTTSSLMSLLYGLFALVVPPIIHLLNRRRFDTVDWAAMQFLSIGRGGLQTVPTEVAGVGKAGLRRSPPKPSMTHIPVNLASMG